MKIRIVKVVLLLLSHGPDYITVETDLPNPTWPYEGVANLKMKAARGTGKDYIKKHFPKVPLEVITPHGTKGE